MNKIKFIHKSILIFLLFFILTAVFTYPLILKAGSVIPGFENTDEPFGALRTFWHQKYSPITDIKSFLYDFNVVRLNNVEYISPSYSPAWSILIRLLTIVMNEVLAYNIIIISSFLLSGLTVFFLTYSCYRNTMASIFSGIIYTFSPYHFVRSWQHMTLAQIQWFPLYIFALFNLYKKIDRRNILLCAVSFLMFMFTNYYYAYFGFLITLIFLIFIFLYGHKGKTYSYKFNANAKFIGAILLIMAIIFLITLPMTFPIIKTALFLPKVELIENLGYRRSFSDLFEQSARPLSYFLPTAAHPLFGKFTERFVGTRLYGDSFTEHALYLGWIPLLLGFIGFRRQIKNKKPQVANSEDFYIRFFAFLALAGWFLSQPPWWKIGQVKIFMPSLFLYKAFPMFRAYSRFGIIVMLSVAALAGAGLNFILGRFKSQKTKIAVTSLFCGLVIFEFWNYPSFKVIDVSKAPKAYYWLKEQPGSFTIAEYPLDIDSANDLYRFYQTKHGREIINCTVPGTRINKITRCITKLSEAYTSGVLKWLGVKYVLVHRDAYLKTGLIEEIEELNKIPNNPGLRLVKAFPAQQCPSSGILCAEETGTIDIYEVAALAAIEPKITE